MQNTNTQVRVNIVGGGLAGCEAAWQLVKRGIAVDLYEMRPEKMTPAHKTNGLAELVCSNSFKSQKPLTSAACLKRELAAFDSLILAAGYHSRVPAGDALAVDRLKLSQYIEEKLTSSELFTRKSGEIKTIADECELEKKQQYWIVATGPLTSSALAQYLLELCGTSKHLYFYDAIAPLLDAGSIDESQCFWQGRGEQDKDYLNIALNKQQYLDFVADVASAEKVPLSSFEKTKYFECCLPIEVMVERGVDTLRYGPLKPIGLSDPKASTPPYAVIQLRREDDRCERLSMVGMQTKMKWPEQKRVFSKLPGLKDLEILRYGSVHRNTYIDSPNVLRSDLSAKNNSRVHLAGQVVGVEGYLESTAMGAVAGMVVANKVLAKSQALPPKETFMGALLHYVTHGDKGDFAPMNVNLGLVPSIAKSKKGLKRYERRQAQCQAAMDRFDEYHQDLVC